MVEYIVERNGRKRPATKIICSFCKKEFLKQTRFIGENNYCSHKCFTDSTRNIWIKLNCSFCEKEFERNKSDLNSNSNTYFCCRKCKDLSQRVLNDTNYRRKAFEEFPHVCIKCGYKVYTEILEVHHIDKNRNNNNIDNLQILCPNCHTIEHWGYRGVRT